MKRWQIVLAVIGGLFVFNLIRVALQPKANDQATASTKLTYDDSIRIVLAEYHKVLDAGDAYWTVNEADGEKPGLHLLNRIDNAQELLRSGLTSPLQAQRDLATKLRPIVEAKQKTAYPAARKAMAKQLADKGWEDDITVTCSGPKNEYLHFVGGTFAANRNIKSVQEAGEDGFKRARFKQVTYQWFKGQSDYTYYTLEVPDDGVVRGIKVKE